MNLYPAPLAFAPTHRATLLPMLPRWAGWAATLLLAMLAGCGSVPTGPAPVANPVPVANPARPAAGSVVPGISIARSKSRWTTVAWVDLPGFEADNLFEAWNAWIRSCERPGLTFANFCADVRRLSIATPEDQREWMRQNFQPHRVENLQGEPNGLLTGYFEPQLDASRVPTAAFTVPIYQPPRNLGQRKPWFNRHDIDTLPEAQAALQGRAIAYVADPVDALVLQIQGSGRLRLAQPDGSAQLIRVAFAGTNDHPYRSIGRWLLDQGLIKDASWPGIKAFLAQNPQRQQEVLWSNPRYVFFKEEPLSELDAGFGPKGAQGVALTPGRSIAVDPESIPYGTPVWLVSKGPQTSMQRLVLAQDTGSAITGAVRADYFAGWGAEAQDLAGRLRQPLQMWVIWPK